MFGDFDRATDVRGWQAAVVTLGPIVWAFGRLHRHSPSAGSTSDLVAKLLGERTGLFTGLLQLAGYLLLAVGIARGLGVARHCCWSMTSSR